MSRTHKKSKAVPVVTVLFILVAALCAACFLFPHYVAQQREQAEADLEARRQEVIARNQDAEATYSARLAELESESSVTASVSWPEHKTEGWDLLDLTNYPLENPTAETRTRADLMANGMLLVNEWHSRPEDFDEGPIVSVGKYLGGNDKVQVSDYNVMLFPVACDALWEALEAARAEGMEHYMVSEGYRTYETQNTYFQNKVNKLSSKYSGDALLAAAKKEVNYPGTSEFNSGLAFTLRLYDKNDPTVSSGKYSASEQGRWMNENCWRFGLIFRFPQNNWPLEGTVDKSFKTGVSARLNLYRYVGKGNAAVMHYMDFCMEEYIEYLEEHPHIALFENGVLKYEIYRQVVGEEDTINVQLTRNARSHESSLDNMGGVITVFSY